GPVLAFARNAGTTVKERVGKREMLLKVHETAVQRTNAMLAAEMAAHLRAFIDQKRAPSYGDELPDIDLMNGLAEVLNAQNIVDTTSRDELVGLMQSMPGGSIGLAGPRGAGKSTLITQLTQLTELHHNDGTGAKTRKVLGIFTSAPVQYDGREFILHLFSAVCSGVLQPETRDGNARSWEDAFETEHTTEPSRYEGAMRLTIARARRLTSYAAVFLLALAAGSMLLGKPSAAPQPVVVQINGTQASFPAARSAATPPYWEERVRAIGLEPLPLATAGLQCLIVSLLLAQFARGLAPAEKSALTMAASGAIEGRKEKRKPRRRGRKQPSGDAKDAEAWAALIASAAEWDLELRYQQSFTSGWSGALKLPIGLDTGASRSTSLIARQLTFPELASAFREFLRNLEPWYVVVIGIDELDKIATAEKAHQFVNEVKAVFGVRGVFYLVSVSDSAISSFARRGLAVRDAFDSAFDEIVRIGYLDHAQAKSILSRRVIGLSEPIVGFCHCLSGGLPRDLIRACRALFTESNRAGSRRLGALAAGILRKDLLEKVDGSITHVLDLGAGSIATSVLVPMRALRRALEERSDLQPACQALINVATRTADEAMKTADGIRRSIADTAADLAIYTVFCVTINDAFTIFPSGPKWRDADAGKVFSDISSFRRALSLNSQSTNAEIAAFRERFQMNALTLP
ncbi:MAG: hypothetical protein JWO56_1147, partial [Acidobacteria bacterium]|nr:hypothetical protein [Acidobacteriota bacterium]